MFSIESAAIGTLLTLRPNEALAKRKHALDEELASRTAKSDDNVNDLSSLEQLSSLAISCSSAQDFVRRLRSSISGHRFSIPAPTRALPNSDTRFQDAKDIERDSILINDNLLVGNEAKYDGIVSRLVSLLTEVPEAAEVSNSARHRFARALLNASNRTCSGGDVYEILDRARGQSPYVVFTPDSMRQSQPLKISIAKSAESYSSGTDKWNFGIVANVEASLCFLCYNSDMTEALVRVHSVFQRSFGLPLLSVGVQSVDDGRSDLHKEQFALANGTVLFKVENV